MLARGGMILTTGGFADNERMVEAHAPDLLGHRRVSDGLDDGSGIEMAVTLGAAVHRMGPHQLALTVIPGLACRGIVVNDPSTRTSTRVS